MQSVFGMKIGFWRNNQIEKNKSLYFVEFKIN